MAWIAFRFGTCASMVKLRQLNVAVLLAGAALLVEHLGEFLNRLALPRCNLGRVQFVLGRQLGDRLLALDRLKRHLGFELSRKSSPRPHGEGARVQAPSAPRVPDVKPREAPSVPAVNYRITDETELGKGAEGVKFRDNIAAIEALKKIETEDRRPTPAEQRIFARYVGWGAGKCFPPAGHQ